MLPAEYTWLEPVLVLAAIVFVIGLIGNILAFGSRFVNALVTALLVAIIGGALNYHFFSDTLPNTMALDKAYAWLEPVLIAAAVVFVVDLIGNMLSFSNRFVNAVVTAVVFAVIFGALTYVAYKDGTIPAVAPAAAPAAAPTETAPAAAPTETAPAAPADTTTPAAPTP